jgi:hypothetical protein
MTHAAHLHALHGALCALMKFAHPLGRDPHLNNLGERLHCLEGKVFPQSMETGRTAELGEEWGANEAHDALSISRTDWKVTDHEGMQVFDMLAKVEPCARRAGQAALPDGPA